MSALTVVRCHGGGVNDNAAMIIFVRRVVIHKRGAKTNYVKRADQIHVDDFLKIKV